MTCDLPPRCAFKRSRRSSSSRRSASFAVSTLQCSMTYLAPRGLRLSPKCAKHRALCWKFVPQQGQIASGTLSRTTIREPCFARRCDSSAFSVANAHVHEEHANVRARSAAPTVGAWVASHDDSIKKVRNTTYSLPSRGRDQLGPSVRVFSDAREIRREGVKRPQHFCIVHDHSYQRYRFPIAR